MAMDISDEQFAILVGEALDELPSKYTDNMNNVAIVYEDEPTLDQRIQLKLHCNQSLFGLYQGIPLPQRGAGYNLVLPDKITIFKNPILSVSPTTEILKKQIKHTLWHEIAHHFGLNHNHIHDLEQRDKA
jgi:predicted Zn-dependent protease with MMP-like domain